MRSFLFLGFGLLRNELLSLIVEVVNFCPRGWLIFVHGLICNIIMRDENDESFLKHFDNEEIRPAQKAETPYLKML